MKVAPSFFSKKPTKQFQSLQKQNTSKYFMKLQNETALKSFSQ